VISTLPLGAYIIVGLDRGIKPCGWFYFLRPWFHSAPWDFWRPAKINSNKTQSDGREHLGSSYFRMFHSQELSHAISPTRIR
jgi:hypothetical protein